MAVEIYRRMDEKWPKIYMQKNMYLPEYMMKEK